MRINKVSNINYLTFKIVIYFSWLCFLYIIILVNQFSLIYIASREHKGRHRSFKTYQPDAIFVWICGFFFSCFHHFKYIYDFFFGTFCLFMVVYYIHILTNFKMIICFIYFLNIIFEYHVSNFQKETKALIFYFCFDSYILEGKRK